MNLSILIVVWAMFAMVLAFVIELATYSACGCFSHIESIKILHSTFAFITEKVEYETIAEV
jgi:hypothetical protein